ncbi:centrosomal protein of 290 kDa [Venturia canescens]|uniref:centrosomal protein of 290 kDa n=1 Tax=Venturia canescens TaxID=32260 RepID=UPI001C9C8CCF|nr:centrosomal protein of 290 kDa [Venturia canescens]
MVRVDWDRVLSIKAESLTDDEIEDLFPMVIRCDIDDVEDVNNLRALMKLAQEMLQHKDNQVESLLLECDELKEKVASAHSAPVKSQTKPAELVSPDEIEVESSSKKTEVTRTDTYSETMRTNDKIKTLLNELEGMEEENDTLKRKLEILREEMEDATESMDEMTEELEQLRSKNLSYKEEIDHLQLENETLMTKLRELNAEQEEKDKMIDDFSVVIDSRVGEWKNILDERDAEINRLKKELSHALEQSVGSVAEQNKTEIAQLNEEIVEGKRIIVDLQEKLLEAATELNESAGLIEKLKNDAKRINKTGRRKEQRDLLRKIQEANEKMATLQTALRQAEDESALKSQQLCEVLVDFKKYEDRDRGLADTIKEAKELKEKLTSKNQHVKDLITVINNLEMLNSCREMQILALREKLGMPEDEEISIDGIALKSQEDARVRNELIKKNEVLEQQNLEMKSDIRTLRYKLSKLEQKISSNGDTILCPGEEDASPKKMLKYHGIADEEITSLRQRAELDELRENVRIVIDENEALRKGMHEILDSIRDQDGKSEVEVHSGTLERLLEALDVRHVSGWYHPAMRIQERLNVVQGSNSELRSQLKQMRKDLQKKDALLRKYAIKDPSREKLSVEDSESEEITMREFEKIQSSFKKELADCQRERETLSEENRELRETTEQLTGQLQKLDEDLKTLETDEDEMKRAFASKSRECAESALSVLAMKRKCTTLESLLNVESTKSYKIRKESIETENALRKFLTDMEKRNKMLTNEIAALRSNLSNSVSLIEFNELKDKYEEKCIHLRTSYEVELAAKFSDEISGDAIRETEERGNAATPETFDESSPKKSAKCEASVEQLTTINAELRQQLVDLQKHFSDLIRPGQVTGDEKNENNEKHEEKIRALTIENESLRRNLEISREEIEMHSTTNSLKIFELDSLRHQILDLHAVSEDKETIARLGFELNICRNSEVELSKRKIQLETEILHLREDLEGVNKELDETKMQLQDCRKICSTRCRCYENVIDFLRSQYAGSTSLTALQRFNTMLKNVVADRVEIDRKIAEAEELRESAKLHQELLTDRLAIVERLRDLLEDQIGSNDLESMMQSFSENSQYTLNDIRLKRRITQLENELRLSNEKLLENQSTMLGMEHEMINIQSIWYKKPETTSSASEPRSETKVEQKTVSTQAEVENQSKEVQSEPFEFGSKIVVPKLPEASPRREIQVTRSEDDSTAVLREQLDQALNLASKRSALLIKYESQMVEYQAKVAALEEAVAKKNFQLPSPVEHRTDRKEIDQSGPESGDNAALKSTISSLQKLLNQKEETIERYQNLLKNDRDEHSSAAARFQQEIKALREEMFTLQEESERKREHFFSVPLTARTLDDPIKESKADVEAEEKMARLAEKASTLEAELNVAKELGERWHRLAEERLQHMDHMRERLEEQHKNELESYRLESLKWQTEADTLRKQLSDNRMQLAKGNISLVKELQERDTKIHELSVAYQQLQSEFELMETMTLSQPLVVPGSVSTKVQEMAQTLTRDQANHFQSELDQLKRQIKSQSDKEKMYKEQIADLKQQISRGYMAKKTEERRVSNREMQLEKKLKALEEELYKARTQLDREYRVQEAKRVKTAEELALWEKQKKWQQIAERTKRELREKVEEFKKLTGNYEKLRAVVSCMEREKWYLRSKLRSENACFAAGLNPPNDVHHKIVESLQIECQTLRDRVKELTDRLESEDSRQTVYQLEQQRRRIAALEAVAEGNTFVVDQLERLEATKATLEKSNIRLESENFELRMEIEKRNLDTPRLREKVEHLEKYVELLKNEKSSESSPRSTDKQPTDTRKSIMELEKTVFILKRVVEKLQVENKRLKESKKGHQHQVKMSREINFPNDSHLKKHYELAKKRVVALETDLQLAEQRILMLENVRKEEDSSSEVAILKQQLAYKSELLDKVKQLLTRAAINEKALRQKIQQIELKQTLATIPECPITPSPTNSSLRGKPSVT